VCNGLDYWVVRVEAKKEYRIGLVAIRIRIYAMHSFNHDHQTSPSSEFPEA
jgi:hypothetical protein